NLMIDAIGSIKITDFGLAILSPTNSAKIDNASVAGANTSVVGTPLYMAPEQFNVGSKVDERSDIYSFGIVFFEMISGGKLPFDVEVKGDALEYFRSMHSKRNITKLDSPLYPLIATCLAKNPRDRYPSFQEVSTELKSFYKAFTGKHYRALPPEEINAAEHMNFAVSYNFLGDNN